MRVILTLLSLLLISAVYVSAQGLEVCDDGTMNTTACNPCANQKNVDQCKAKSPFHECSAKNCTVAGGCDFDCQCRVMCPAIVVPCEPECGPGFKCQRAECSCAQVCVPVKQCTWGGKTFDDGATFEDECNQCWCENGVVGCTKMGCPSNPTCPNGKKFEKVCANSCALLDCMEGNDCEIDHCNNCEAYCKPNYCMYKGKKINNNMPFIDGCKRCICENGVTSCEKPDPKCVKPKCPRYRKFEQVCENKCAVIRPKCEADMIGCQIDQCDQCAVKLCQPRPCATLNDCDAELGQVCYFKNVYDKSVAGVCRSFQTCDKDDQCARGSKSHINKTNKKCYCIPNEVSTNALEFDVDTAVPTASSATMTSASTIVALVTAAAAAAMF